MSLVSNTLGEEIEEAFKEWWEKSKEFRSNTCPDLLECDAHGCFAMGYMAKVKKDITNVKELLHIKGREEIKNELQERD